MMTAQVVQARGWRAVRLRPTTQRSRTGATQRVPSDDDRRPCRVWLESITAELAQRVFGQVPNVTVRGYVAAATDIALEDRLAVTAGPFLGTYRVVRRLPAPRVHPNAVVELGLEATPEAVAP
jgi:hypothetical protein